MLVQRSPDEVYRRVDFDARIAGADPRQLVVLCHEQLASSLGTAIHAARRGDNARKSQALTRALAALTALQMGIDHALPIAAALTAFFDAARRTVLDNVIAFDPRAMRRLHDDVTEIAAAFARTSHG